MQNFETIEISHLKAQALRARLAAMRGRHISNKLPELELDERIEAEPPGYYAEYADNPDFQEFLASGKSMEVWLAEREEKLQAELVARYSDTASDDVVDIRWFQEKQLEEQRLKNPAYMALEQQWKHWQALEKQWTKNGGKGDFPSPPWNELFEFIKKSDSDTF